MSCVDRLLSASGKGRKEFTSPDLITWIEEKLNEHGIQKVVPDDTTLEHAYRRALQITLVNHRVREIAEDAAKEVANAKIPSELATKIRKLLEEDPTMPWDRAIAELHSFGEGGE